MYETLSKKSYNNFDLVILNTCLHIYSHVHVVQIVLIQILLRYPVEQKNYVPDNVGDELNKTLECEKHREECESGGEEEEEDGEDDCPQEKLLHCAVSTVHPVPEGIILLAYVEAPQGNNTLVLG